MGLQNKILTGFLLLAGMAFGQKTQVVESPVHPSEQANARYIFPNYSLVDTTSAGVVSYLKLNDAHLNRSELVLENVVHTDHGKYFHYHQEYMGYEVVGSHITAGVNHDGVLHLVGINTYSTEFAPDPMGFNSPSISTSLDVLKESPAYLFDGIKLELVQQQRVHSSQVFEDRFYDADGNLVHAHNLFMNIDTTIQAWVFNPDPLTVAGVTYVNPYKDLNDGNGAVLDSLRVLVNIPVKYNNGSFILENNYFKIVDVESPNIAVATKTTNDFFFSRSDDGFEDVNALYHLTHWKEYLINDLNINIVNYVLQVDVHAFGGSDNSRFDFGTQPPKLFFGEGGVDDAEDADVVLHEFGHAMSYSAAPNTNYGTERGCLDEAFGDYQAASYSRRINPFDWNRIFTWDGHNEYWAGRNGTTTKLYTNLTFNGIYTHTDIWVKSVMDIWASLGYEATDKLAIEALYGYTGNMTMNQAAAVIFHMDTIYNQAANHAIICNAFCTTKIFCNCKLSDNETQAEEEIRILNQESFSTGGQLQLVSPTAEALSIELIDMYGRVVTKNDSSNGTIEIDSSNLKAGTYILRYRAGSKNMKSIKLIRLN